MGPVALGGDRSTVGFALQAAVLGREILRRLELTKYQECLPHIMIREDLP